jgi:hypothetical protein
MKTNWQSFRPYFQPLALIVLAAVICVVIMVAD